MSVPAAVPRPPGVREGVTRRALFGRLGRAGRVTQVSAPAGSGKTFLLRSWIGEGGLADSAAWGSVQAEGRDAPRVWLSVFDALRGTAGGAEPARFTAEFSGSERTVAEYLLAEVLERQSEEVRRLLLRTSVLKRVSGPVADYLTGGQDGERILQELEAVNAFVVSLDARRTWFRYHHLFAELLQLELRRTEPGELPALHMAAAGWFAHHGYPAEAVRHAQAAENWSIAAWLLCDNWISLTLNGQQDTAHELLTGFPAGVASAAPELTPLAAADELNR